ncbi:hypothetical protein [Streptomyces hiroshimensis]|uniref:Uncharacterized protein n=1 Tax=Streptomyces hiroshimensis TaxID=66424 RepID=A0ABQ2Y8V3_9ACTN|nr:hypothetical protein [Streptomyces hiroshimensis]GGX76013.1 hypothetical protein GCM10010324_21960 [Streptomyces hiroshimensis]
MTVGTAVTSGSVGLGRTFTGEGFGFGAGSRSISRTRVALFACRGFTAAGVGVALLDDGEEVVDGDMVARTVLLGEEAHGGGDESVEAVAAHRPGAFGGQVQGELPGDAVHDDVDAHGVEPLLQQEVDKFGRDEVVLVDHVYRGAVMERTTGCQQVAQEVTAPARSRAGEHLLELQLCRGLLDPRLDTQGVHDGGSIGVINGHRAQDHVAVAAVQLIAVVAGLVDGDPPPGPGPVVGRFQTAATTEVRSEQSRPGVRRMVTFDHPAILGARRRPDKLPDCSTRLPCLLLRCRHDEHAGEVSFSQLGRDDGRIADEGCAAQL